jgi:hypothetical protein
VCSLALSGVVIISSAFHFWPFDESKAWQMLYPSNLAVLVWVLILMGYFIVNRDHWILRFSLPHLSVLAYLVINLLSIAFAQDFGRAINFTFKLGLMFVGGYLLFRSAISDVDSLRIIFGLIITAVIISMTSTMFFRFGLHSEKFGFFNNAYKYGTYIGTLVPLCVAYLFTSPRYSKKLLATFITFSALLSVGSLGGMIAIVIGLTVFAVTIRTWFVTIYVAVCLVSGIGLVVLLSSHSVTESIRRDVKVVEEDGVNLKQRYIEWQAELNLLEARPFTGTAAGCINEHRSYFYHRLPKLNTLKAFDQNGWIATGAETGIWGLVCFCWIVVVHLKRAYSRVIVRDRMESDIVRPFALANLTGLIAACCANLFSSLHYNGILVVFVLVLALISRVSLLGNPKEC